MWCYMHALIVKQAYRYPDNVVLHACISLWKRHTDTQTAVELHAWSHWGNSYTDTQILRRDIHNLILQNRHTDTGTLQCYMHDLIVKQTYIYPDTCSATCMHLIVKEAYRYPDTVELHAWSHFKTVIQIPRYCGATYITSFWNRHTDTGTLQCYMHALIVKRA